MAKIIHKPVRMCITCRDRHEQNALMRLQCIDGSLEYFTGNGRSFYVCKDCLKEEKKLIKSFMRQCRSGDKDKFISRLKEIITDDRKS